MIKRFLSAKTAKALELEQLKNNMKYGRAFSYSTNHDGKQWYAWYLADARELVKPKSIEDVKDAS